VLRGAGQAPAADDVEGTAETIFRRLREERLRLAREDGVAPFIVASDRTLRDIAALRPRTLEELRLAHGIGPQKAERYGRALLDAVARSGAIPPPRA
jgi:ATP-dependent DNA helicase RecQ